MVDMKAEFAKEQKRQGDKKMKYEDALAGLFALADEVATRSKQVDKIMNAIDQLQRLDIEVNALKRLYLTASAENKCCDCYYRSDWFKTKGANLS